ncbi:MAG: hypothetical protein AB7S70_03425 [Hyphomicrobium sp.]
MTVPEAPRRPLRVLHAPVNVGNQPWTLSRAERRIGLESDLVTNYQTWLGYPADRVLSSVGDYSLSGLARRTAVGLAAPFRYDVLHYYFGRSLLYWDDIPRFNKMPFTDLRLARRLGRRIFMTLQGCDARLAGDSNRRNAYTPCGTGRCSAYAACISTYDAQRRTMIDGILPLCDRAFYLNPELGHYAPTATFLPYANVDIDAVTPREARTNARPIIVHAPSDAKIKGTDCILAALDAIRKEHDFELVLVQGKTHDEAMRIYRQADLVVDQVLAGWYGGFAVEVMAMGKPVACYIRDEDLHFIPPQMWAEMPILRLDPSNLVADFKAIFAQRDAWRAIGMKSRRYVERWHHPDAIARALRRLYLDPSAVLSIEETSSCAA